jgi:hypothetical protein
VQLNDATNGRGVTPRRSATGHAIDTRPGW